MKKLILFLAFYTLPLIGCTTTAPNVRPTTFAVQMGPNEAAPTPFTVTTPLIWVQAGTENTYGMFAEYEIRTFAGGGGRGGEWWPTLPDVGPQPPLLTLRQGQTLRLMHDQPADPTFWVVELDAQNLLLHSAVIQRPNNQYTPITTGFYRVSIRAQWRSQYHVTYFFNVEVKP